MSCRPIEKPKIAIVENDFAALDVLCCDLCEIYDIYPISDPLSSLQIFKEIMPNLLILDLEFIRSNRVFIPILKQPLLRDHMQIPIIFMVASAADIPARLTDWKSKTYIAKPYDMADMRLIIQKNLQSAPVADNPDFSVVCSQ